VRTFRVTLWKNEKCHFKQKVAKRANIYFVLLHSLQPSEKHLKRYKIFNTHINCIFDIKHIVFLKALQLNYKADNQKF